jgi:hypothetical protein
MKVTKNELKSIIKEVIEESNGLVQEAKIKKGHEMFATLNTLGKLMKKKEKMDDKSKEVGKEIKKYEPEVKKFLKTLDDKIAETNRVIIDLKEIEAKLSQTPSYKKAAEELWKDLGKDSKEFKKYAEQFKGMQPAKDSLGKATIKKGRSAKEFDEVVEEGFLDGVAAVKEMAKGAVDKIVDGFKKVIALFTKNDKNLADAKKLLKEGEKAVAKEAKDKKKKK